MCIRDSSIAVDHIRQQPVVRYHDNREACGKQAVHHYVIDEQHGCVPGRDGCPQHHKRNSRNEDVYKRQGVFLTNGGMHSLSTAEG